MTVKPCRYRMRWGVINEDEFSFTSPRAIEGDECDTLAEAVKQATELVTEGGVAQASVVECRFSARHEVWVEVPGRHLTIEARGCWDEDRTEEP